MYAGLRIGEFDAAQHERLEWLVSRSGTVVVRVGKQLVRLAEDLSCEGMKE